MKYVKIRFLYHKPIGERGVGKVIVALTWFYGLFYNWKVLKYNYSHEEVWLLDIDQCFSSTTRGNWKGVRFAPASEVLKHPERWDAIEVIVDSERLEVAVEEAKRLVGRKYDFLGIFGFLNPFPFQSDKKWYCSEILDWFKKLLKIHPKRHKRISPRRSAYILAKRWGEPVPIKNL